MVTVCSPRGSHLGGMVTRVIKRMCYNLIQATDIRGRDIRLLCCLSQAVVTSSLISIQIKGVVGRESRTRRRGGGSCQRPRFFLDLCIIWCREATIGKVPTWIILRSYSTKSPVDTIDTWQLRMKLFGLVEFVSVVQDGEESEVKFE